MSKRKPEEDSLKPDDSKKIKAETPTSTLPVSLQNFSKSFKESAPEVDDYTLITLRNVKKRNPSLSSSHKHLLFYIDLVQQKKEKLSLSEPKVLEMFERFKTASSDFPVEDRDFLFYCMDKFPELRKPSILHKLANELRKAEGQPLGSVLLEYAKTYLSFRHIFWGAISSYVPEYFEAQYNLAVVRLEIVKRRGTSQERVLFQLTEGFISACQAWFPSNNQSEQSLKVVEAKLAEGKGDAAFQKTAKQLLHNKQVSNNAEKLAREIAKFIFLLPAPPTIVSAALLEQAEAKVDPVLKEFVSNCTKEGAPSHALVLAWSTVALKSLEIEHLKLALASPAPSMAEPARTYSQSTQSGRDYAGFSYQPSHAEPSPAAAQPSSSTPMPGK